MIYFLSFNCYGTHLHGDPRGSFERTPAGTRYRPPNPGLEAAMQKAMVQEPYTLTERHRPIVLKAFQQIALHHGWKLHAAHVSTTHVHVIIEAPTTAERVMGALKAAASRSLNDAGMESKDRRRWARHGSTRELKTRNAVDAAIKSIVHDQGEPMSVDYSPRIVIDESRERHPPAAIPQTTCPADHATPPSHPPQATPSAE